MKNVITYVDGLAFYADGFFGYIDVCLARRPCVDCRRPPSAQAVPTAWGRWPLDWLP
jgi:hypothetical protein